VGGCSEQARLWATRPAAERQQAVLQQLARSFGTDDMLRVKQFVEKA
jgi:hypothetical protein